MKTLKNKDTNHNLDDFNDRLKSELDKMKVNPIEKECVLNLIERERNRPTNEDEAIDVYSQLLEISFKKLKRRSS